MSEQVYEEAFGSVLDYTIDWTDWLSEGESIAASSWALDDVLVGTHPFIRTNITGLFVTGGAVGEKYRVTNTIITDSSPARTDNRYFMIHFIHRSAS
jgi:hypothetical protein